MKAVRLTIAIVWLATGLPSPALAAPQTQGPEQSQQQSQTQPQTQKPTPPPPDNVARIREAVSRPSTLRIENGQLKIYVEVIAKWPSFAEIAKGYDLMNGPTNSPNAMSHKEFLNIVTPKELYGSGGIQAGEVLTMAIVNYFGQKAIKKGIQEIGRARNEKEIMEIRAQIDRELAALAAVRGGK